MWEVRDSAIIVVLQRSVCSPWAKVAQRLRTRLDINGHDKWPAEQYFCRFFIESALDFHGEHKGIGFRHSRRIESENGRLSEKNGRLP